MPRRRCYKAIHTYLNWSTEWTYLENDDDDTERSDVAGQPEHLDLLHNDGRAGRQKLDEHDDRTVQIHVGVVQRELDEDGARSQVQPVELLQFGQFGGRDARIAAEVEGVAAALWNNQATAYSLPKV